MKLAPKILIASLLAAAPSCLASSVHAVPIGMGLALTNAVAPAAETVRFSGGGRGGGRGGAIGGPGYGWNGGYWRPGYGLAAGAALGGYYGAGYGYDSYYGSNYYDSDYYGSSYGYGGDATAYCSQRFKSYDPSSGTYLGYDGVRHPCP